MCTSITISLIIISDSVLKNSIKCDKIGSFFTTNLKNLGYDVNRIVIIPSDQNTINYEIYSSNNRYDITIIVDNLSNGIVYRAFGKILNKTSEQNEQLKKCLKKRNLNSNDDELVTPSCLSVLEGETYPLLHINRIFLIHENYMENIFKSALENYLMNLKKPNIFKKIANIHMNGNNRKLDHLKSGIVKYEIISLNSNSVKLEYFSESLDDLLEFEEVVKKSVSVACWKNVFEDSVYSDQNLQVKNAIQVIETCFEKYKPENTMISFNGGKDCTVLLHLMMVVLEKKYPCSCSKPICFYVQGKQPFPEQEKFIEKCEQFFNLKMIKLQMDMRNALKLILDRYPNVKACLMGTRKTDPFSENLTHFQMTDRGYPEIMRVNPLLHWTYYQIWDYLLFYKVPYCELYDLGYTSLGNTDNTLKNPNLLYKDILDGEVKYLPAYKLLDEQSERSGRFQKS